jgi:hypothetical protein
MAPPRAPALDEETPQDVEASLLAQVSAALNERHGGGLMFGEAIEVAARSGDRAAYLRAAVGNTERAHELELFARDVPGDELEGALGVLVDYLDAVLEEWFAADREGGLPLDFEARPYAGTTVFVRQQLREYALEAEADRWLEQGGAPDDED